MAARRAVGRGLVAALFSAILVAAAVAPRARAADEADVERARIEAHVAALDADDAKARAAAEDALAALGEKARAALEAARDAATPEARRRIDGLLTRLADAARTHAGEEWAGLRGGPQRSGVVGGAIPRTEPEVAWRVDVPDRTPLQGAVVATRDVVVTFSADGTVRCFEAASGARRWLAVLDHGVTASAAVASGRIVVPTADGVVALDARDGHEAWRIVSDYGCRAAPAIVGRTAYVALRNRGVAALDVRSGTILFERKLAPQGALLGDADLLVTGAEDGTFRALDPKDGRDRWKIELGGAPVMGPTLAAPGVIAVMTADRGLQALRTTDGKPVWKLRTEALSPSESISAAAGRIFVTDTSGWIHSFDAATGRKLWHRNEGFSDMGSPGASAEAVCFASRGRMGCRDAASGDFLWRLDADVRDCSSPVIAAGRIFILYAGELRCWTAR